MALPALVITSMEDVTVNFEAIEAAGTYAGAGAPTFTAHQGDYYFRKDTPTTANQRIYINTAEGANWVGIL